MTGMSETEPIRKYIFCNKCGGDTNHMCKGEHHRDFPNLDPDDSLLFVERLVYRFWVCAGCESGTLEEYYIFDVTDKQNASVTEGNYFPERTQLHAKAKEFKELPGKLASIYIETIRAYNNNLPILCAVGIRSLLEGICADKNISGRNLKIKVDNMISILPKNIVTSLHNMRFIGNEAAHELASPSTNDLRMAIEICEDLLNYLYELDYKARHLSISRKQELATNKQKKKSDK
jgi:hypothetical protein